MKYPVAIAALASLLAPIAGPAGAEAIHAESGSFYAARSFSFLNSTTMWPTIGFARMRD